MKKSISILLMAVLGLVLLNQNGNAQNCIYCNSNTIADSSSAIGAENISTGLYSLVSGFQNEATGDYSGAFGIKNIIGSEKSFAIGIEDTVSAKGSIAIGAGTAVTGLYSVGIGLNTKVHGNYSVAIGNRANSMAMNSYSFGNNVWSGAQGSITIGASPIYLKNTISYSLMVGFNSDLPTFFVSSSDGAGTTGKVGIGTDDPDAKLDVAGDIKTEGFKLVNGSQGYGKILQSDDDGLATWVDPPSGACVQCDGGSATGDVSSIIGINNIAEGTASFAGGLDSQALGDYSFAFGNTARAEGLAAVSLMKESQALGMYSFAIGKGAIASGDGSFAIGFMNRAIAGSSYLFGEFLETNAGGNVTIGFGDGLDYLKNNKPYSLMVGFKSDIPTFFVGPSSGAGTTGNVGIGTSDPIAKVQIKDGDIFIEDINRGIVMKSPDGNCWRGTVDNNGALQFVQVNCDDLTTGTEEQGPVVKPKVKIYPNPAGNQVFVSIDRELAGALLEIVDLNGKALYSEALANTESFIDLSGYTSGMYVFKIIGPDGKVIESVKVIKR